MYLTELSIDVKLLLGSGGLPEDDFVVEFKRQMAGRFEGNQNIEGFLYTVFGQEELFETSVYQSIDYLPEDISGKDRDKVISELLDMRTIAGDNTLEYEIRRQLRTLTDPLEYRLNMATYFSRLINRYPQETFDLNGFNIKEGDNGSLRQIQNIIWMDGIKEFENSRKVIEQRDYVEILDYLDVLLSARAWLHLNKKKRNPLNKAKSDSNDTFEPEDIYDFVKKFGSGGIEKLQEARREIWRFSTKRIRQLLAGGMEVAKGVEYREDGLHRSREYATLDTTDVALNMLNFSGMRELPIADTERQDFLFFRNVYRSPNRKVIDIISGNYTYQGILEIARADAIGNLFPSFSEEFKSFFNAEHWNRGSSRLTAALKRLQRINMLENYREFNLDDLTDFYRMEYTMLDFDKKTALKLALFLKGAIAVKGINTHDALFTYLRKDYPEFLDSTLEYAEFLINTRKEFFEAPENNKALNLLNTINNTSGIKGLVGLRELIRYAKDEKNSHYIKDITNKGDLPWIISEIVKGSNGIASDLLYGLYNHGHFDDLFHVLNYVTDKRPSSSLADTILRGEIGKLRSAFLFAWADRSYNTRDYIHRDWTSKKNTYEYFMSLAVGVEREFFTLGYRRHLVNIMIEDFPEDFQRRLKDEFFMYHDDFADVIINEKPFIAFNPNYSTNKAQLIVTFPDFRGALWRIAGTCSEHDIIIGPTEIYVTKDKGKDSLNLGVDILDLDISELKKPQEFIDDLYKIISKKGDVNISETPEVIIERLKIQGSIRYVSTIDSYVLQTSADLQQDPRLVRGLYGLTRYIDERLHGNISSAVGVLKTSRVIGFKSELMPESLAGIAGKYLTLVDFPKG